MTEAGAGEAVIEPLPVGRAQSDAPDGRRERGLIKAAQRGSEDAVEALVRAYWADAHRIALGVLADPAAAEDVAQEAVLAAIRALPSFDRRRPFRPWLHRIVTNRALDWHRVVARRGESAMPPEVDDASVAAAPEVSDELMALLRSLAAEDRAIVALRYLLGLNSREIGEALGMPEGTVRSRLSRALATLRTQLERENDDG